MNTINELIDRNLFSGYYTLRLEPHFRPLPRAHLESYFKTLDIKNVENRCKMWLIRWWEIIGESI